MNKKSVLAIAAGVAFIIVVTTLCDIVLHVLGVFPATDQPLTDGLALLATSYRVVIGVAGAWLTAKLAPQLPDDAPMKHAMWLGYVGIVLGMIGLIVTWNMNLGPKWYPIALVVLAVPQCWLGGKLYMMQHAKKATT